MKNPHILILSDGVFPFAIGGMQKHTQMLAKHLLLQNVRVTLVHAIAQGEKNPSEEEAFEKVINLDSSYRAKFRSIVVPFPSKGILPGHYIRNSYKYSKTVFESVRSELNNVNLVYIQGFSGWYMLEQKRKLQLQAPLWVNFHGLNMFQPAYSFRNYMESLLMKGTVKKNLNLADKVISLGGALTDLLIKNGIEKANIIVQPNGIDAGWLRETVNFPSEQKKKQVLFIGRNDKIKGFTFLEKLMEDPSIKKSVFFHIVGEFDSDFANSDHAFFYGKITSEDELKRIMDQCDALLMLSHSEGLPTVILEAMARGLPVISTPVGAIPEIVDSSNGLLIKRTNVKEVSGQILSFLYLPSEKMKAIKENGIITAGRYTWPEIVKSMLAFVE